MKSFENIQLLLLHQIIRELEIGDIIRLSHVCKRWYQNKNTFLYLKIPTSKERNIINEFYSIEHKIKNDKIRSCFIFLVKENTKSIKNVKMNFNSIQLPDNVTKFKFDCKRELNIKFKKGHGYKFPIMENITSLSWQNFFFPMDFKSTNITKLKISYCYTILDFNVFTNLKDLFIYEIEDLILKPGTLPNSLSKLRITIYHYTIVQGALPPNLTYLHLGSNILSFEVNSMPPSLTYLRIDHHEKPIKIGMLPTNLQQLIISEPFSSFEQDSLPLSLKSFGMISANNLNTQLISTLTNLTKLEIFLSDDHQFVNYPKLPFINLVVIFSFSKLDRILEFSNHLPTSVRTMVLKIHVNELPLQPLLAKVPLNVHSLILCEMPIYSVCSYSVKPSIYLERKDVNSFFIYKASDGPLNYRIIKSI